ncbi:molybdopterin molybdochelatase [Raineyella antarctica]|uniref:Molybdopterin molybdenumtransferase n=1 Tax=Raineyella antarctica TaxID=1577474 RepID=A0A1G6GGN9_9ACTN|nr:gephyrin-like molybdotransferase Glp [Raineyella antarctica]SDB80346.1 molybdopterin molybdochelatase [Raineyella antarctica]
MGLFRRKKQAADEAPVQTAPERGLPRRPEPNLEGLRSVEDHRDYLLSLVQELPAFGQTILDAVGLSLCEDIIADLDLPRFDNSAMDGYGVHAADLEGVSRGLPRSLPVVRSIAAGDPAGPEVEEGTVVKIMTGAPVPPGVDAVVPYEHTDRGSVTATFLHAPAVGENIRPAGDDIAVGDHIASIGDRLGPRQVGMLAGIGIDQVLVRPRPRVVVISTGSELVQPGLELHEGQIYDSNSFMLAALARSEGAQVFRVGIVSDDPSVVAQTISDQLVRADIILTTGGVSQGDHDVVKAVVPRLGPTDFCRVAMQPGKPQGFALIGEDRTPVIMLPGNPVSAFVSFEVFVRPVLRKLMGVQPLVRPVSHALTRTIIRSPLGKTQFQRGVVTSTRDGRRHVAPMGGGGSHKLGDLAQANALVIIPPEVEVIEAGNPVEIWMIDDE